MFIVIVVLTWIKWPLVLPYLLGGLVEGADDAQVRRAIAAMSGYSPARLWLRYDLDVGLDLLSGTGAWVAVNRLAYGPMWLDDWWAALGHYGTHAVEMGPWGLLIVVQVVVAIVRWVRA